MRRRNFDGDHDNVATDIPSVCGLVGKEKSAFFVSSSWYTFNLRQLMLRFLYFKKLDGVYTPQNRYGNLSFISFKISIYKTQDSVGKIQITIYPKIWMYQRKSIRQLFGLVTCFRNSPSGLNCMMRMMCMITSDRHDACRYTWIVWSSLNSVIISEQYSYLWTTWLPLNSTVSTVPTNRNDHYWWGKWMHMRFISADNNNQLWCEY